MIDLLKENFGLILTTFGGGFIGWFFERKRKKAETNKVETDVLAAIQQNYATLVNDMKEKYKEQDSKIDELTKELSSVKTELADYKKKYYALKKEIDETK